MNSITIVGHVDEHHQLHAKVPHSVTPGDVKIQLLVPSMPDEDEAGAEWEKGIAREWAAEWSDPREDIYDISDGEPSHEGR